MSATVVTTAAEAGRRRVKLDRTFAGTVDDAWDLWTTKDGIESWWGPGGFYVTVQAIDLRPGGVLVYTMSARGEQEIAYMKAAGQPLSSQHKATYTEVTPKSRLGYEHVVDFIPNTPAYAIGHLVELSATEGGVRVVLSFDAMHSDEWTQMATMGWQSEFEKLAARLEGPT